MCQNVSKYVKMCQNVASICGMSVHLSVCPSVYLSVFLSMDFFSQNMLKLELWGPMAPLF